MHGLMVQFISSVLEWKYSFWENLDQKINILSLNLVPRLIQISIMSHAPHALVPNVPRALYVLVLYLPRALQCILPHAPCFPHALMH